MCSHGEEKAIVTSDDSTGGKRPGPIQQSLAVMGASTGVAIVLGLLTWLVLELAVGQERSSAVGTAAWVAVAVLAAGVVYSMFRALGGEMSDR
ncbi:hypothetical protein [Georgenia sp. Z1491]|uniref:hypothetical protein n=1 Tax=Georgenia sp. Z1491 TaxID=3416707 RepID=UPI003CE9C331